MKLDTAARGLAELGNVTRLRIFRLLVRSGETPLAVGEIQSELRIPASTLSHHISRLVWAGLVEQRRQGRVLFCRPRFEALNDLVDFLYEECCRGGSGQARARGKGGRRQQRAS